MKTVEQGVKQTDTGEKVLAMDRVSPDPAKATHEARPGELCPQCREGRLDYDGLLNLVCPKCGYALGGCFT